MNNLIQPEQVGTLLRADLGFNTFCADVYNVRQKLRTYISLDGLHNNVHGTVGSDGHMNFPQCAAFDPIFWLHHWYVFFSPATRGSKLTNGFPATSTVSWQFTRNFTLTTMSSAGKSSGAAGPSTTSQPMREIS